MERNHIPNIRKVVFKSIEANYTLRYVKCDFDVKNTTSDKQKEDPSVYDTFGIPIFLREIPFFACVEAHKPTAPPRTTGN
jgi:hypothetical protein